MIKQWTLTRGGAAGACLLVIATGPAAGQVINEILASHTGTDDTEFVELFGPPGGSLAGLSLIAVEGSSSPGTCDEQIDFGPDDTFGANGFFLVGNAAGLAANYGVTPDLDLDPNLENDSTTYALVETSSLSGSSVAGGEVVLDSVALDDGDAGDQFFFGAPMLGPDGTFFPAGARRVQDGVDTDAASDFVLADFNLGPGNTPTPGDTTPPETMVATIMEIQGDGQVSPLRDELIETTGIVTAINASGSVLWIQDPEGDGDPSTSDGILVAGASGFSGELAVGDLITVTGRVEEQQFGDALPLTRIVGSSLVEVGSRSNPLPEPVLISDLPNLSIAEAIRLLEALEGMRVAVENGRAVAPTNGFGEFALLVRRDFRPTSGYDTRIKQIFLRDLEGDLVDYNPERLLVDDSTLSEAPVVEPGDLVKELIGVLDYTFGNYKVQPTDFDIRGRDRFPTPPVSMRNGRPGNATITTFNVENLFDLVDQPGKDDGGSTPTPEELETKLKKLALAVELELELPEVLIVQEVENTAILQELGNRVNEAAGTSYAATSFESSDGRGIEVGFLYDTARARLLDAFQLGTGALVDPQQVRDAFGATSASPGREPLVGLFRIGASEVWVIGNHFKSKGGDDPIFGLDSAAGLPFDRITEEQRRLQAEVVRAAVDAILDGDPEALILVAGDLNDFAFREPGEPIDPVAIIEQGDRLLINLVDREKASDRYTFLFDGNSQVLDYILVNEPLEAFLVAIDILHFNAAFPASLEADPSTPIRSSDHDAVEARFDFPDAELAAID